MLRPCSGSRLSSLCNNNYFFSNSCPIWNMRNDTGCKSKYDLSYYLWSITQSSDCQNYVAVPGDECKLFICWWSEQVCHLQTIWGKSGRGLYSPGTAVISEGETHQVTFKCWCRRREISKTRPSLCWEYVAQIPAVMGTAVSDADPGKQNDKRRSNLKTWHQSAACTRLQAAFRLQSLHSANQIASCAT